MKKTLTALLMVLCLVASVCFAAAEQAGIAGPYEWKGYELTVESVRTGNGKELDDGSTRGMRYRVEDSRVFVNIPETLLEIRLLGGPEGIKFEDIRSDENIALFRLTDAAGEEIPIYSWCWWGVGFDEEKGFGSYDLQEGFMLYYFLPDGTAAEDLTLTVLPEE